MVRHDPCRGSDLMCAASPWNWRQDAACPCCLPACAVAMSGKPGSDVSAMTTLPNLFPSNSIARAEVGPCQPLSSPVKTST